jgi:hypothetical protein
MRSHHATLTLGILLSHLPLMAQDNAILIYDIAIAQVDTIQPVAPTDTVSGFMPHGLGTLPGWEALNNVASPAGFMGTALQLPPHAANTYDLTDYPVRVAGELRWVDGDSSRVHCSAQLVGPWPVLTASHCLREIFSGTWLNGRMDFFPVFDDGMPSIFGSVRAVRYYVPLQSVKDNALIELEHPIGEELGWIGLGFTTDSTYFDDRIVHKFCYPGDTSYANNGIIYNGDTLYHFSTPMVRSSQLNVELLGVPSWQGIPGESGSGVWVTDNIDYHVLGVCTWSAGYRHTLMDAGTFQQFRTILDSSMPGTQGVAWSGAVRVYPNPVQDQATIELSAPSTDAHTLSVNDMSGRIVDRENFNGPSCIFFRKGLAAGTYLFHVSDAKGISLNGKMFLE